jgi:hypothetical protein
MGNYTQFPKTERAIAARVSAELAIPKYSAKSAHRDVIDRL